MRFVWGPIPPSRTFDAEGAGWTPLRSVAGRWAAPQAALGMVPCLVMAGLALRRAAGELPPAAFVATLALPAALVPAHELAHALGYLVGLRSPRLVTGVWPSHGIWYVIYDAPLRRGRVLLMLAAPLLAFSVAPGLAACLIGGPCRWGLAYLALMHAALCVGDLLSFARIGRQVSRGGWVHNQGWATYWSLTPPDLAPWGSRPAAAPPDEAAASGEQTRLARSS